VRRLLAALSPALLLLLASPSHATLDIEDGGPVLSAGRVRLRVTNAGILGNAFYDRGLSNDPSFEFPDGSGNELLDHAELWVGGRDATGTPRVSGGPILEWRPTLAPEDTVLVAWHGRLGARQGIDDDGDGKVDEERLNAKDDDGDGEIDEDLGFSAQELLAADYVDDRPEAVNFVYPNGETHHPLGLSVHQEVLGWGTPGLDGMAGIQFTITNHGDGPVRDVYLGMLVNFQSMVRTDPLGQTNDKLVTMSYDRSVLDGRYQIRVFDLQAEVDTTLPGTPCFTRLRQSVPVLVDGVPGSTLPAIAVVPLEHTTDPMAFFIPGAAFAPARVSFRTTKFSAALPFAQGGPPILDSQRYDALRGRVAGTSHTGPDDYVQLVSCGPFRELLPGATLRLSLAFVAATRDSLPDAMANAAVAYHGVFANLLPDSAGDGHFNFDVGNTGLNGHEACIDPPPGVTFLADPNCAEKFVPPGSVLEPPFSPPVLYQHGTCTWTDADCDVCTGIAGNETAERWSGLGLLPPSPRLRVTPDDRAVRIEWDNGPEILQREGIAGQAGARFIGYHVYKLADWRESQSQIVPANAWALFQAYYYDTTNGGASLAAVTDSTLDYERILFEQRLYPPGRYNVVDREVLNGFDYAYSVAAVIETETVQQGIRFVHRFESPLVGSFQNVVRPRAGARNGAGQVWVVPNPYRASAGWDRPNVVGGEPITHLDFMGLPQARAKIRIWTLAGDLVTEIEHDGTNGDGEAHWNLVSRNGQDVVSGIYLFTVDSSMGHQTGRFVVIR
jgi:hypothetical protein